MNKNIFSHLLSLLNRSYRCYFKEMKGNMLSEPLKGEKGIDGITVQQ